MRLIRGAPGSGKTSLVFREFSAAIQSARTDLRIVVPTATLVRHYQHELARSGLVFDPRMVVSLSRFALDCAPDTALVPAGLVRALLRDALERLQLPEFAAVAGTRGMADVVLETMARFENAGCTPDRLSRVRNLSPHGRAFLRVWREVEGSISARGFATRGQVIRRAAGAVAVRYARTVWMDGFLNFSPLEAELVRAMAATCDLTLTLTEGRATYDARRLAMELGASDQLLAGAPRRPQTIAVRAPSPEGEADEIARRILELNGAGIEFPAIAVALRDVETWLPLLRTAFDRFGIPARCYFSTPVRRHPVAVFLGGLIESALSDWDFESALRALRAHPAWGHSADFDRFDFRVREAMPGRGAGALLGLCESEKLRSSLEDCLRISSWRGERARPAVWQRRFGQLAESLYRVRTIAAPADYAAIETARSHAAGMRAWSAALETAAQFWTAAEVSLEQFHSVVSGAIETASMQIPDDRHNVVHVMSAFEARQWQVQALFVCGMTARDYPRRAAQNLLFPDSDPERLRHAGIPLRTAADDDRDEDLLFDSLRTRASQSLILTVSSRDSGGNTLLPSRHFEEAATAAQASACRVAHGSAGEPGLAGNVGTSCLSGLADQHRTVSLTSLEDLAKCRFRFFSSRTLVLKGVPDRPEERLSFSAAGLIVHEAMEDWLTDRTRDFVGIFETTFDDFCRKRNIQAGYRLEVQRVVLRRVARKVNESAKWPLESSETEAEYALDFPGGVKVTCRIDRIDHLGNGDCIIIDYKSGKTENVRKLVERQTSLQAPLYALAVRENKGLNPVAMVYLAVRENEIFGWGKIPGGPADLDLKPIPTDWIDGARSRTVERLRSFLAGDVHPEPTNADDCMWCDFSQVCRIETQEPERLVVRIGAAGGS